MRVPALSTALLCVALPAFVGCGSDESSPTETTTPAAAISSGLPLATPREAAERGPPRVPQGQTSGDLVVKDLVRGTGAVAEKGDVLLVRYVGGIYETGERIEYTGNTKEPVGFLLGAGDWSLGWEAGMPGMRIGGRRVLIFPTTPDDLPPGSELGDTLVYVIDLVGITEPSS